MNIEQMMQEARESGLDDLGRVAYEAWCHSGRRIPSPWDLKDSYEKAMWIESVKAVAALVRAQAPDDDPCKSCVHMNPCRDGKSVLYSDACHECCHYWGSKFMPREPLKASPDAVGS